LFIASAVTNFSFVLSLKLYKQSLRKKPWYSSRNKDVQSTARSGCLFTWNKCFCYEKGIWIDIPFYCIQRLQI